MKKLATALAAACWFGLLFSSPATSYIYDEFNASQIDKSKWLDREFIRTIGADQRLHLGMSAPHADTILQYPASPANELFFADPESVLSIRARVTILEGSAQDAAAARTGLRGRFYNDGTPGPGMTGDISAGVAVEAASDGQYAHWYIHRDTDAAGSSPEVIASGIFTTPVSIGSAHLLQLSYDPGLHRFVFQIDTEEVVFGPAGLPPRNAATRVSEKALSVELLVSDELSTAFLVAAFDDIHKNGDPYDDFSAPLLDASRWNTGEFVRAVEENRLTSIARILPGQKEDAFNYLRFSDPQSISQIQVSATPDLYVNSSGAVAKTFVSGSFYNDGSGDQTPDNQTGNVTAEIWIGGTETYPKAGWTVWRAADASGTTNEVLAAGEFDYWVQVGDDHVLSLSWTGHSIDFLIRRGSYEKAARFTPTGTLLPPTAPWKAIGSRITEALGREAQIRSLFGWVSVDNPPQLQYGQPLLGQLPSWGSATYEIPVQAGQRIFALLYKEEEFSSSLSLQAGVTTSASQGGYYDQAVELTPSANGYTVVKIANSSESSHGYRLVVHTEQTFPRLSIGQTYTDQETRKGWRSTWFAIPVEAADAGKNIVVRAVSKDAQTPMGAWMRMKYGSLPDTQLDLNQGNYILNIKAMSVLQGLYFVELRSSGFGSISVMTPTPEDLFPAQTKTVQLIGEELNWYRIGAPAAENLFIRLTSNSTIEVEIWDAEGQRWEARTINGLDNSMMHVIRPDLGPFTLILKSKVNLSAAFSISTSLPELQLGSPTVIPLNADPGWFQVQVPEGLGGIEFLLESNCTSSLLRSWQYVIGAPGSRYHASNTSNASNRWDGWELYPTVYYVHPAVSGCPSPAGSYTITARPYEAPITINNERIQAQIDVDRGSLSRLTFKTSNKWIDLLYYPQERRAGLSLLDMGSDTRLGKYLQRGWKARNVEWHPDYLRVELFHPSGFENNILLSWFGTGLDIDEDITAPERVEVRSLFQLQDPWNSWWAFPTTNGVLTKTNSGLYPASTIPSYPVDGSYTYPSEPWIAMWDDTVSSPASYRDIRGFTFSDGVMAKIKDYRNVGENNVGDYSNFTLDVRLLLPAGASHVAYHFLMVPEATYEPIRAKTSAPWVTLATEVDRQFTGPGAELTYTVTARNTGSTPATAVVVEDVLPQNLELVPGSISGGGVYNSGTRRITWNVGELETDSEPFRATYKAVVSSGVTSGTQITKRTVARYVEVSVGSVSSATTTIADPVITGITPSKGGNGGATTVTIRGSCLDPHAAVYLRRAGQPDIVAGMVSGVADGSSLGATFNLIGKALGTWDVVVVNAGGGTATLPAGFTIQIGGKPQVWVDVIGRTNINVGRSQSLSVTCGNNGNTDAYGVLLWIRIPKEISWRADFQLAPVPEVPGYNLDLPREWDTGPIHFDDGGNALIPIIIPRIGPNETVHFPFSMKALTDVDFEIQAWAGEPLVSVPADGSPSVFSLFNSPYFMQCMDEIAYKAAQSVLKNAIALTIEQSCVAAIANLVGSQLLHASWKGTAHTQYSLVQALRSGIFAAYRCSAEFVPQLRALDFSIKLTNGALDLMLTMGSAMEACTGTLNIATLKSIKGTARTPRDPNDKSGLEGYDPDGTAANERRHLIAGNSPLLYMIQFENLKTASGSVLDMRIVDQLEASLDWSTFGFDMLQVGTHLVSIPAGSRQFSKTVDFRPELPAILEITGSFNTETGLAQWSFSAKDPYTGELTEFLPPNVDSVDPKGRGWVTFRVNPRIDLPTGTVIRNKATIDFEIDVPPAPMDTPEWINTIDNSKPSSRVATLDALQSASSFTVKWGGTDAGSGVRDYTIYVSDNDGSFAAWLTNTKLTTATYTGLQGHRYAFYSLARDNVGNVEDDKAAPDAATTLQTARLAGSGYVYHDNYRGTFQIDASSGQPPSGYLKYYYTRTRMNVVSTAVTAMIVSGGTTMVAGTCSINGVPGFNFEATIVDANPDQFSITIKKADGSIHHAIPLLEVQGSNLSFR